MTIHLDEEIHLLEGADYKGEVRVWCEADFINEYTHRPEKVTCRKCLKRAVALGLRAQGRLQKLKNG